MMSKSKVTGLRGKTARGAMYMTLAMAGFRLAHLVSLIWLARILTPDDFGRVSLVVATLAILAPLSELGISQAIIHTSRDTSKASFYGFIIVISTGALVSSAVAFASGPISSLLGNADVSGIMRWMAVSLFINSLGIVPIALQEKRLLFGRVGLLMLSADLAYISCALILAYSGYGVWSLAIAHILRSVVKSGLGWSLSPSYGWLVPVKWDRPLVRSLLGYGIQTVASSSLALINSTWDNLFVGAALGTRSLGFYSKSYDFMNLIKSVNDMANRVLFPSYTVIGADSARLSRAYLRTVSIISLITIPTSLGLLAIAPELVPTVLGDTWLPMVPVLQVLAFMSLVRPLSGTTAPLFLAVGRPSYNIWVSLVHTVIMIPLAMTLVGYGIVGVASAIAVAYAVGWCFNIYQVQKCLPGTAVSIIRAISPSAVASVGMTFVIFAAKGPLERTLEGASDVLGLIALVLVGVISFVAGMLVLDRPLVGEAVSLIAATMRRSDESVNDGSARRPWTQPDPETDHDDGVMYMPAEEARAPIFIVGASRSGTSLMRSCLNNHPDVCIAGETHYFDDLRPRIARTWNKDRARAVAQVRTYFAALLHRPYGHGGDAAASPVPDGHLDEYAALIGDGPDAYFEAFCRLQGGGDGTGRWGEKTPRHVFRIDDMLATFPHAKVICMIRDPRAVVASYRDWKNQGGFNFEQDPGHVVTLRKEEQRTARSYDPLLATLLWRSGASSAAKAREAFGSERVWLQTYEALVSSPSVVLKELADWLGVDFDPRMIDAPMSNSSFAAFDLAGGIDRRAVDRWRSTLSRNEMAVIESGCRSQMRRAGYEPLTGALPTTAVVRAWARLPLATARAALANRSRIVSLPQYVWRRLSAILRVR